MVYITYTMATWHLPDIQLGPQPLGLAIYIRQITRSHGITINTKYLQFHKQSLIVLHHMEVRIKFLLLTSETFQLYQAGGHVQKENL